MIELIDVQQLKHIENFSRKKVLWLRDKILNDGVWTIPIKIESTKCLVLDGQHRMEVAKMIGLSRIPSIKYNYVDVEIWSLRKNHVVSHEMVMDRSLKGDIYPYKTVKHRFPFGGDTRCAYTLESLL